MQVGFKSGPQGPSSALCGLGQGRPENTILLSPRTGPNALPTTCLSLAQEWTHSFQPPYTRVGGHGVPLGTGVTLPAAVVVAIEDVDRTYTSWVFPCCGGTGAFLTAACMAGGDTWKDQREREQRGPYLGWVGKGVGFWG